MISEREAFSTHRRSISNLLTTLEENMEFPLNSVFCGTYTLNSMPCLMQLQSPAAPLQ